MLKELSADASAVPKRLHLSQASMIPVPEPPTRDFLIPKKFVGLVLTIICKNLTRQNERNSGLGFAFEISVYLPME